MSKSFFILHFSEVSGSYNFPSQHNLETSPFHPNWKKLLQSFFITIIIIIIIKENNNIFYVKEEFVLFCGPEKWHFVVSSNLFIKRFFLHSVKYNLSRKLFDLMSFQQTTTTIYHFVIILKLKEAVRYQSPFGNDKQEQISLIHNISVQNRESQVPEAIFQQLLPSLHRRQ